MSARRRHCCFIVLLLLAAFSSNNIADALHSQLLATTLARRPAGRVVVYRAAAAAATTATATAGVATTTATATTAAETTSTTLLRAERDPIAAANRGDARGASVLLEDVSVFCGPAKILQGIDWRVEPRTKWALVGQNGAGKSTLLKALVGQVAHEGNIVVGTKERVGYLQQTAVSGSQLTVYDEACAGMTAINDAKAAMEQARETGDFPSLEKATAAFDALEGYKQEQNVASVLCGLGFSDDFKTVRCDELSGGWQMRVAFARQLLSEPTLSLLDEPGNHLDAAAKSWLARYLKNYSGAGSMILVTHDTELLASMDHIAEIVAPAGSLQVYKSCNYQQYLTLKKERAAAATSEYERNAAKAAKLQAFVDRFGASATKASQAQSRVKMLEKMRAEGLLDKPSEDIVAERFKPTMILPNPPRAVGECLLSLKSADLGYEVDKPLLNNVQLDIMKGMKLLIRGPNGSGKSTLLHSIRGSLPLLAGQRTENPDLRLGMFTQDLAQELDPSERAVDLVTQYARQGNDGDIFVSDQEARSAMGRLGLSGEKPLRRIRDLSGGEKARVGLSMFALKPSNVYFLDEPSNHLDTECVEALSEGLSQWDAEEMGAIVVVSHDRTFCEKGIQFTHIAHVTKEGKLTVEERGARPSDWIIGDLSSANGEKSATSATTTAVQVAAAPVIKEVDPKLRKKAYNAPKRITKLGQLIEEAEAKIVDLDEEMIANGSAVAKLAYLQKEKDKIGAKIERYEQEWMELEELLMQVAT